MLVPGSIVVPLMLLPRQLRDDDVVAASRGYNNEGTTLL
jgi:hypothetical protein